MSTSYAARMNRVQPNAVGELLRHGARPDVFNFAGGYPDATLFPVTELSRIYQEVILDHGQAALQYTVANGTPRLRELLAARMRKGGIACTADEILILQGSQQGLDFAARLFIDPGDVIVTESPTFVGALIAFNPSEPSYVSVRTDADGMDTDDLAAVLARTPGAKFIYTVPDFQNPSGVTLSVERRKRLVELANQYDVIVIEDSPYVEIRFEGERLPTLKSFDTENRVIHLGTFSKILVPGVRLGWVVASKEIIAKFELLKLVADTQCSTLNMHAVTAFLEQCDIDAHIAMIRDTYRRKKNLMLDVIRETFPENVRFTDPAGGMFTWLSFPQEFDTAAFMRDHALPAARVAYVPGATFFATDAQHNHARVNFTSQSDERIVQGIGALGRLLKAHGTTTR